MKTIILVVFFFSIGLTFGQRINVKDYGATGDGTKDDTNAFNKAIAAIKQKYTSQQKQAVLYVPNGVYLVSKSIILDKYTSMEGEFVNTTILRAKAMNTPVIILEKNFNEAEIYNSYNYVKNFTLQGTDYQNSFINERKTSASEVSNIGILVKGLRTRIEDMQIEGFLNSGIEVNGSYYTYINHVFFFFFSVGLLITNTSTSVYLTQSELRFNSVGIIINNNSCANFINNNMIESNIARFNPYDVTLSQSNTNSTGRGIVIKNASANIITNNYLENHFVNITLENAKKNIINSNFYAISDNTVLADKNQISLQMIGDSQENIFESNTFLTTVSNLEANKIIIGNADYSSNKIDVGKDNARIKTLLNNKQSDSKKLPKIPNN